MENALYTITGDTFIKRMLSRRTFMLLVLLWAAHFLTYFAVTPIVCAIGSYIDMSLPIDDIIPFVPCFFIIYTLCVPQIIICQSIAVNLDGEHTARFITASITAYLICMILYVCVPTVIERDVDVTGPGLFNLIARLTYEGDVPYKLFPSMHCTLAWLSWIGLRGRRDVNVFVRIGSLICALLVFASTVLVKQHYVLDIPSAVLVCELAWELSRAKLLRPLGGLYERFGAVLSVKRNGQASKKV